MNKSDSIIWINFVIIITFWHTHEAQQIPLKLMLGIKATLLDVKSSGRENVGFTFEKKLPNFPTRTNTSTINWNNFSLISVYGPV